MLEKARKKRRLRFTRFEDRLRSAGFTNVRTEPMDGWQKGIVHSFIAERPR